MNWSKIKKEYPNAYSFWCKAKTKNKTKFFDSISIRVFTGHGASGGFKVSVYRKKTKQESAGENDWQMIRIGHIQSYLDRDKAENVGFEMAFEILEGWIVVDMLSYRIDGSDYYNIIFKRRKVINWWNKIINKL